MKGSGDFSIGSQVWPGTSKLIEEMGELNQVLGKLIATAGDTEHWSGDLRQKFVEEIGDVLAAIVFFFERNMTVEERVAIDRRYRSKLALFEKWHTEQPTNDPIYKDRCVRCGRLREADTYGCLDGCRFASGDDVQAANKNLEKVVEPK